MWTYTRKLEYPVNIKRPNAALAKVIITQLGGADCKKIYITLSPFHPLQYML